MKYHPDNLKTTFRSSLKEQKLSEATIKYYLSDVRVFLRFIYQVSGDYEVTPEMFESYENFLKSGNLPTKTINRKLSSLRIFSTFLLKHGYLKENVMTKVKNNKSGLTPRQFRFSTTAILLIVFFIIIAVGGFLISTTKTDLVSFSNSIKTNPVVLSKSIQTGTTHPPELLRSQSITDISVEGGTLANQASISAFGKVTIPTGELSSRVAVTFNLSSDNVYLTSVSPVEGTYYVEEQKDYFVVHLSQAQKNDVTFNWFILSNQLPVDKLPR